jgi:hypothetical protein
MWMLRSTASMSDLDHHLSEAREALAEHDLHGTLAWIEVYLHALGDQSPAVATAVLDLYANVLAAWVGATAATLARDAARAVDEVEVLHRLGGALAEAKELEPALGVLTRAARLDPERAALWHDRAATELRLGRHRRAATLLESAPASVRALLFTRALHAVACFFDQDAEPARAVAPRLGQGNDERSPALISLRKRLDAMLLRHDALAPASLADPEARARAWHAVWTGEVVVGPLVAHRPTLQSVRAELAAVAEAVRGLSLVAVTALRERDSELLARALAEVLKVPFERAPPPGPSLVAVWDVSSVSPLEGERLRAEGHLVYVHATRRPEEHVFAADLVGRVGPPARPPWGHDGEVLALVGEPPPPRDLRPLAAIAAEVAACQPADFADANEWSRLVRALSTLPTSARVLARAPWLSVAQGDGVTPSR